jgi:hypothetical protein
MDLQRFHEHILPSLEESPQNPGLLGLLKDGIRSDGLAKPGGSVGEIDLRAHCTSFIPLFP